ncbi:hypothetical protein BD770DRAFT_389757 [Pilaira anomala]|nr:hypothetical protein BD770DRAFT_389757 [Pilaira anomala]
MQKQFSQLGYFSVDASISLPEKKEKELLLSTCYQELSKATSDLSFFPPLLISHGEIASRISQKFVSNKPASGLIMIEDSTTTTTTTNDGKLNEQEFPISEFEPRFPILMISNHSAPKFLDGWIDQVELKQGNEFKDILQWMDELGM